ncbi:MAG TPA: methyltransferase [Tepidisphaeraceae bacterium]|jgi:predicted transcriptional regulator|nr:methyltransferase [Tepidisphaeraceae bacterium]
MMAHEVSPDAIMQLAFGYWGSKTLLSAVELGLFTELAKGPLTLHEVSSRVGLHERSARDFLDALVALGMLKREQDKYANTAATDLYLDRGKPIYMGGMLEMMSARLFRFWADLTEGIKTGEPQNEAKHGGDLFDTLYSNPQRLEQFLSAMTGLSLGIAHAMAEKFPWSQYQSFVDIGVAQGGLPVVLAQAHHHLTGIGADLACVRPIFEKYVASHGLRERLRFAPLDFFREPLPKADVVIMGHILHDWDLPTKKMLLGKAYDALPAGGALIVFEAIIDDDRRSNAFGLLMSLNMLIETRGGFDYTGADCATWMREAGFKQTRIEHLSGPDSMVIGVK